MRITRCPRCRAQDIAADAHPARVLDNGVERHLFVCRGCYRAAELEYRISCEAAGLPYRPLPIRDTLRELREFYRARLAETESADLLLEDADRDSWAAPIRDALADVERRLGIAPVDAT